MKDIRFVVRFFKEDQYLYSVHCTSGILDQIIKDAKDSGFTIKVLAYENESEVCND